MLYDPKWQLEIWQRWLLVAIDVIERDGWTQGETFSSTGVCMVGALARAAHEFPDRDGQYMKILTALEPIVEGDITGWNDVRGRTKKQVIAAFRKAANAEISRERHGRLKNTILANLQSHGWLDCKPTETK